MSGNNDLSREAKMILDSTTTSTPSPSLMNRVRCGFGCGRPKRNATRSIIIGSVKRPSELTVEQYKAGIRELKDLGYLHKEFNNSVGGRSKTRRNKNTRKTRAQKKRSSK